MVVVVVALGLVMVVALRLEEEVEEEEVVVVAALRVQAVPQITRANRILSFAARKLLERSVLRADSHTFRDLGAALVDSSQMPSAVTHSAEQPT